MHSFDYDGNCSVCASEETNVTCSGCGEFVCTDCGSWEDSEVICNGCDEDFSVEV